MILQILPKGDTSIGYIEFLQDNFSEDIKFILVDREVLAMDSDEETFDPEDVKIIKSRRDLLEDRQCRYWVKSSDAIIVNWADGLILAILKKYISKIAIVFWGGDLRSLKDGLNSQSLFTRTSKKVIKGLIEDAKCIITLLPGDFEDLCSFCSPKGKWYLGSIMTKEKSKLLVHALNIDSENTKKILLGNSSTPTNRHFEAFDYLSHFCNEQIEIYAPLSYGDMDYRSRVIKKGEAVFGDKFKPLLELLSPKEYMSLLSQMHVAVFNQDRQQGMGNIQRLLAIGSKVFLSSKGPMLNDFTKDGFTVFETETIPNLSFSEFLAMDSEDKDHNRDIANLEKLANESIDQWEKIFAFLTPKENRNG